MVAHVNDNITDEVPEIADKKVLVSRELLAVYATKEEVQKEQKETTRILVTLAMGSVALIVLTATLMGIAFHWTVGEKVESAEYNTSVKIDSLKEVINVKFEAQQKQLDSIKNQLDRMEKVK